VCANGHSCNLHVVKRIAIVFFLCVCSAARAQVPALYDGQTAFEFLRLPPTAHLSAVGGRNVSLTGTDAGWAYVNPALLNDSMLHQATSSYAAYLAGVQLATLNYAAKWQHRKQTVALVHGGIHLLNYGRFTGADEFGNVQGTFTAADFAPYIGIARRVGAFSFGMNAKLVYSTLAGYSSVGLGFDLGMAYHLTDAAGGVRTTLAAALRNVGGQLTGYTPTAPRRSLPTELEAGITHRLRYAPFRLSITASQLLPTLANDAQRKENSKGTLDAIASRLTLGVEFMPSRAVHLRLGYNLQRRAELSTPGSATAFTGFTGGLLLQVKRWQLQYGYSSVHASGGLHQFTVGYKVRDTKTK